MTVPSDVTQSATYKRAHKHYLKTRQPISDDSDLTPFRIQEKRYKTKFPPPHLDDALDPWAMQDDLPESLVDLGGGWGRGSRHTSGSTTSQVELVHTQDDGAEGPRRRRRAYVVSSHPGLVIFPGYLSHQEQRALIRSSLESQACSPNETNLDVHYLIPDCGLWRHWLATRSLEACRKVQPRAQPVSGSGFRSPSSLPPNTKSKRTLVDNVPGEQLLPNAIPLTPPPPSPTTVPLTAAQLLPKLRWANIGRSYHWGSKSYDFTKTLAQFPQDVRDICQRAVKSVPWNEVWGASSTPAPDTPAEDWGSEGPDSWRSWSDTYEPDAGIVNFYQTKDTLMGHVDRSEVSSTTPLVSISLGNAAIFLIGGVTRDVDPLPIILRSGDVVIMSGPRCRRAYHGVPRILEGTLPPHLSGTDEKDDGWEPFGEYLKSTRININVRQVFPRGYTPPPSV